jgi:hypothetical protein
MTDKMGRGRNQQVSDAQLVNVAKSLPGPAFGPGEVSAGLNGEIGPEACRKRLQALAEGGLLGSKKIGNHNIFWFESPASQSTSSRSDC